MKQIAITVDCSPGAMVVQLTRETYNIVTMFGEACDQLCMDTISGPMVEYLDGRNRQFNGLDFRERHLRWVRFTGATLVECDFSGATLECVFADFALFRSCRFNDAHIFESVFAGSKIENCSFNGVTADICNFNAIAASTTDFSNASLRQSRFINARLTTVKFINCDIKDALFQFSLRNEVVYKHSNYEDAHF